MTTIRVNCPKCLGTGITGDVVSAVCSQCKGVGTITANDTDTIATLNTNSVNGGGTMVVVTVPTPVPPAAIKVATRRG